MRRVLLAAMATGDRQAGAQLTDRQLEGLIAGMAGGDTGALERFYAGTRAAVYGFALSILKSPHSAEDVMQDTFVRVFAAAVGYRAQGKPMAWVLTITRNLALMRLRQEKTVPLPEEEAATADPDDFTRRSEHRMLLEAALTTLSDEERQVVMLHAVSGLKHREIAVLLEMPLATVLSKYRRSLAKLEKVMKEENR